MRHRKHPGVVDVLHAWWGAAQNTFKERDGTPVVGLTCRLYTSVLRKVGKALVTDDEYDPDELEEAVRDDWQADSQGRDVMTREMCTRTRAHARGRGVAHDVKGRGAPGPAGLWCDFASAPATGST